MPLDVSDRPPRPAPERHADGTLVFRDRADFRPNLTPSEVMQVRGAMRVRAAPARVRAERMPCAASSAPSAAATFALSRAP